MARNVEERSLIQGFKEILGKETASMFSWAFDMVGIAEDEIEKAVAGNPGSATRVNSAFKLLVPNTELFHGKIHALYRDHCRELIRRVVEREDTRPATGVEVMCGLSGMSLIAPLNRDAYVLYARLFKRIVGKWPGKDESLDHIETHEGAVDELFGKMARSSRLRQDGRKL